MDSEELFNTEDLMENTEEIIQNTEDHETQIDDAETPDFLNEPKNNLEELTENIEEPSEKAENGNEENPVKQKTAKTSDPNRITNLPLAKVKHVIKLDPDVKLVNREALFLITKATEMFVETLAKEAYSFAAQNKKKTLTKNHVEQALAMLPIEL